MTANPSKPKRHPLPRLWMRIADALRLARRFEIRLEMSLEDALGLIQELEMKMYSKEEVSIGYDINTQIPSEPGAFTIRRIQTANNEEAFLKGHVQEEENMIVTVVSGKVFPSAQVVFLILFAPLLLPVMLLGTIILQTWWAVVGAVLLLVGYLFLFQTLFTAPKSLREKFIHHLQTAASERVTTHDC
jgi:hypothetical protein